MRSRALALAAASLSACGASTGESPTSSSARATVDQQIVELVEDGVSSWQDACGVDEIAGVCAAADPPGRAARCGSRAGQLRVVARDPATVARAERSFDEALRLWNHGEPINDITGADVESRAATAAAAAARAYFFLAEPAIEDYLARGFPDSALNVDAFQRWIREMNEGLRQPAAYYDAIGYELQVASAEPWLAASAARAAQLHEHFAYILTTAPVPASFDGTSYTPESYCRALEDLADPLLAEARALFARCQARPVGHELCRSLVDL